MYWARYDKQDEDDQVLGENDIIKNLNNNKRLTKSDIRNFYVRSQSEQQTQNQETKVSGCRFDKKISMTFHFYETTELGGSIFLNFPLGPSAITSFEKYDKSCFL